MGSRLKMYGLRGSPVKIETIDDKVTVQGLTNGQKLAFLARDGSDNYYAICVNLEAFPYVLYTGRTDGLWQGEITGVEINRYFRAPSSKFWFKYKSPQHNQVFATLTFNPQGESSDENASLGYHGKMAELETLVFHGQQSYSDKGEFKPKQGTGFSWDFGNFKPTE